MLTRETNKVRCASADYYSADGAVAVHNSPQFPQVVMTQTPAPPAPGESRPRGQDSVITTENLVYSGLTREAVLTGKGSASLAMNKAGDPGAAQPAPGAPPPAEKPPERLEARWARSAVLNFAAGPKDQHDAMAIEHAVLTGDVDVKHPQLALKSQALDLYFDPAAPARRKPTTAPADPAAVASAAGARPEKTATQSELRRVVAADTVWCDLKDQNGKRQTVLCDHLTMQTATDDDGKLYPRIVNADGNAHAYDSQQDLRAKHVELTMAPAKKLPAVGDAARPAAPPKPADPGAVDTASVELQTMTALEEVQVNSADGSLATGAELYVLMKEGQPHARLVGQPASPGHPDARPATVVDAKQSVVTGPVISFDPKANTASVEGAGRSAPCGRRTPTRSRAGPRSPG